MPYILRLYIAGKNARSRQAIQFLQDFCETYLHGRYELTITDVFEDPEATEEAKIVATPTLVLESPPPKRRIIGDFSDLEQVLFSLDLPNKI